MACFSQITFLCPASVFPFDLFFRYTICLQKNFNTGKNFFISTERAFIFHMCTSSGKIFFSSPEHEVHRVSYCDHSPSVCIRPAVHLFIVRSHFLVYTPASTNINQPAPNLVQMYMTIRSWMSLIMEPIRPELSKLSALVLENLPYLTLFTL